MDHKHLVDEFQWPESFGPSIFVLTTFFPYMKIREIIRQKHNFFCLFLLPSYLLRNTLMNAGIPNLYSLFTKVWA